MLTYDPARNHAVLVLLGMLASAAVCSSQDKPTVPSTDGQRAAQLALSKSGLPTCAPGQDGQVYYVLSDGLFYVCNGSTKTWVQTNLNGLNAAIRVTAISQGSQCPSGGSSIQFGLDQNRNGTLDNSEVSSTVVVCNGNTGAQGATGATGTTGATGATGAAGVNSLVRQDDEPAGVNCPTGGVRIESGLDQNGNGALESSEVTATSYVCAGISNLVNVVVEPAGTNCSAGGQAIQTGMDTTRDGILEPGEVQHTSYVCNGTSAGAGEADGGTTGGLDAGPGCPGTGGPVMARLPEDYCIDTTEVTRDQYQAWLATNPALPDPADLDCGFKTSHTPACEWPPGTRGSYPVVCVDWCDAYAYCQGVGKRMCGRIGGGPNDPSARADIAQSQWYNACTSHGGNPYPYGAPYDAQACNGPEFNRPDSYMTVPVASLATCQSGLAGYQGIYDLSGNVWEWEDSCVGTGASATCQLRGGSYNAGDACGSDCFMSCGGMGYFARGVGRDIYGIRCCSP